MTYTDVWVDACGIATCGSGGKIFQCKGNGLAAKVFRDGARIPDLRGYMVEFSSLVASTSSGADLGRVLDICATLLQVPAQTPKLRYVSSCDLLLHNAKLHFVRGIEILAFMPHSFDIL